MGLFLLLSSNSTLVSHTPMPQSFSTPIVLSAANQPSQSRPAAVDQKPEAKQESSNTGL